MKYALLLRGVNVGAKTRLAMADLRAALESAGFEDVSTYLQSGNAVVSVPGRSSAAKVTDRVRAAFDAGLPWSPGGLGTRRVEVRRSLRLPAPRRHLPGPQPTGRGGVPGGAAGHAGHDRHRAELELGRRTGGADRRMT